MSAVVLSAGSPRVFNRTIHLGPFPSRRLGTDAFQGLQSGGWTDAAAGDNVC
jgi:hypothetical protein